MLAPISRRTSARTRIGHRFAGRRVDGQIGDALEIHGGRLDQLDHQIECRGAVEDAADGRAGEARLDRLGDVLDSQPVARDRRRGSGRIGQTGSRSAVRATDRRRPATPLIASRTRSPRRRSVTRSSPTILTAMFARVPDSMWSMRCEIGWPMVDVRAGQAPKAAPRARRAAPRAGDRPRAGRRRSPPPRRPARARRARRGRSAAPWRRPPAGRAGSARRGGRSRRTSPATSRQRVDADRQAALVELRQERLCRGGVVASAAATRSSSRHGPPPAPDGRARTAARGRTALSASAPATLRGRA